MNAESAELQRLPEPLPAAGWGWNKFGAVIVLAFAAHLAFVFLLGTKKPVAPRAVRNVPVFQLTEPGSDLIRLTDPTLFALPHPEDYLAAAESLLPAVLTNVFGYTEPPAFLMPDPAAWGAAFNAFMQTKRSEAFRPSFKPEPQLVMPRLAMESAMPQHSTWRMAGQITGRRILNLHNAPTLTLNDVIGPSHVQLLVDQDGNVASAVLLESSGYDAADQQALDLARTLRFAPADRIMFGRLIFNWHTVPMTSTNAP